MKIRARAPLRIGIAGGGTDVSPYCDFYGGFVLNATIDRYAYTTVESTKNTIEFIAEDLELSESFSFETLTKLKPALKLHAAVYNYVIQEFNQGRLIPLRLSTFCDAPIGSGLGSSSTLVVSMLAAMTNFLNVSLDDYELARTAFHIERDLCQLKGGAQDQYAAAFGGMNFMEFYSDRKVIVNPLRIKERILCELESSLLLFFTGISRDSATIINAQSQSLKKGNEKSLAAMHIVKAEAKRMKEALLTGDFLTIVDSLRKGWESKKQSSDVVSNERINRAFKIALDNGALAGKVSGAGGGGFILFFVPLEKRLQVIRALEKEQGFVSRCHFTKKGAQAWRVE